MLLSICIPTFNRSEKLDNCLNSILISKEQHHSDFEVCIADNNSSDNTKKIVDKYKNTLNINYHKNSENLGFARNATKVVSLAKGKFTWYGEKCASTMAVAYSSGDMDEPKIVSLLKNCR